MPGRSLARSRGSRRKGRSDNTNSTLRGLVPLMRQLVDINKSQQVCEVPTVKSLPRPIVNRDKVFTVVRSLTPQNVAAAATATGYAFSFALSDLNGYANFTTVFDDYRIDQITVVLTPLNFDPVNRSYAYVYVDYNDSSTPTLSQAVSAENMFQVPGGISRDYTFRPKIQTAYYSTITTQYGPADNQSWMSTQYPGAPYYGLKIVTAATTSTPSALFAVSFHYMLQFKHPK